MNIPLRTVLLALLLVLASPGFFPGLGAADAPAAAGTSSEYKVLSGFKQPFNDDLQLHLSKGWKPVGGISVTTWNNDLYFAQLIARPAKSGQ